jgi:hypothetical protein
VCHYPACPCQRLTIPNNHYQIGGRPTAARTANRRRLTALPAGIGLSSAVKISRHAAAR